MIGNSTKRLEKNGAEIGDAVLVEWEDSYGCSATWQEMPSECKPDTMICRSLGWILARTQRHVVVVPHMACNEETGIKRQGCGDMTIPTASILRLTRIPLKKPHNR
jgi:hypothetical protein